MDIRCLTVHSAPIDMPYWYQILILTSTTKSVFQKESQEYLGPHEPGLQQVISTYYFPSIVDADNFDNTNHDPNPIQSNENRQSTVQLHKDSPTTRKYHYYPTTGNEDSIQVQQSDNERITTGKALFSCKFWVDFHASFVLHDMLCTTNLDYRDGLWNVKNMQENKAWVTATSQDFNQLANYNTAWNNHVSRRTNK